MFSPPKVQTPPPAPTVDQARQDAERSDFFLSRKGFGADMVSTADGRSKGGVATSMLTGQG